jgi:homoserine O-acetyltransferase
MASFATDPKKLPLAQQGNASTDSFQEQGPNVPVKESDVWFDNWRLRNGRTLQRLRIHYATLGSPHRDAVGAVDNAVLVLHWTGSDSRALLTASYMKALFDPGCPLDARRYYLIFPDNLGHGQSSKPSDGLKMTFPEYGYSDLVDIQHKLVTETLGVSRLHAILGMSMGGMNAWQWAEAYPDAMDGIMPVVCNPTRVSGRNLLWRRMVIEMIRSDPGWQNGNYTDPPLGWITGFQVARMMIDGVPHLQAAATDATAADRFLGEARQQAQSADANDALYYFNSSIDYDPEPGLRSIKTRVFAVNFGDDEFNPQVLQVLERVIPRVPRGRFVVQPGSDKTFGHLTMAHPELWATHVGDFMRELGDVAEK